jgi:hypothetical protein
VLLDGKESVKPAPPVQSRNIVAAPIAIPQIEGITPQILEFSLAASISIEGQNLAGRPAVVRFGDLESAVGDPLSDQTIQVALPAGIQAGVKTAQVVTSYDLGPASGLRKAFESNIGVFILQPIIQSATFTKPGGVPTVSVQVMPDIGPRQDVALLLNEKPPFVSTGPASFRFPSAARGASVSSIDFIVAGVPASTYFVRLQIDGAENNLDKTVVIS